MILWVVVPCNLVGVHWRFQRNVPSPSLGSKVSQARNQQELGGKQKNMEAIRSFEMPMDYRQTAWHYNQDLLHSHYCETSNLAWIFIVFCLCNFLPYCCALNLCENTAVTPLDLGRKYKKKKTGSRYIHTWRVWCYFLHRCTCIIQKSVWNGEILRSLKTSL